MAIFRRTAHEAHHVVAGSLWTRRRSLGSVRQTHPELSVAPSARPEGEEEMGAICAVAVVGAAHPEGGSRGRCSRMGSASDMATHVA